MVTEFGCCTYRGAAEGGGGGWAVIDEGVNPPRVREAIERDETEQVAYCNELLDAFEAGPVDGAFWFSFASYDKP